MDPGNQRTSRSDIPRPGKWKWVTYVWYKELRNGADPTQLAEKMRKEYGIDPSGETLDGWPALFKLHERQVPLPNGEWFYPYRPDPKDFPRTFVGLQMRFFDKPPRFDPAALEAVWAKQAAHYNIPQPGTQPPPSDVVPSTADDRGYQQTQGHQPAYSGVQTQGHQPAYSGVQTQGHQPSYGGLQTQGIPSPNPSPQVYGNMAPYPVPWEIPQSGHQQTPQGYIPNQPSYDASGNQANWMGGALAQPMSTYNTSSPQYGGAYQSPVQPSAYLNPATPANPPAQPSPYLNPQAPANPPAQRKRRGPYHKRQEPDDTARNLNPDSYEALIQNKQLMEHFYPERGELREIWPNVSPDGYSFWKPVVPECVNFKTVRPPNEEGYIKIRLDYYLGSGKNKEKALKQQLLDIRNGNGVLPDLPPDAWEAPPGREPHLVTRQPGS